MTSMCPKRALQCRNTSDRRRTSAIFARWLRGEVLIRLCTTWDRYNALTGKLYGIVPDLNTTTQNEQTPHLFFQKFSSSKTKIFRYLWRTCQHRDKEGENLLCAQYMPRLWRDFYQISAFLWQFFYPVAFPPYKVKRICKENGKRGPTRTQTKLLYPNVTDEAHGLGAIAFLNIYQHFKTNINKFMFLWKFESRCILRYKNFGGVMWIGQAKWETRKWLKTDLNHVPKWPKKERV